MTEASGHSTGCEAPVQQHRAQKLRRGETWGAGTLGAHQLAGAQEALQLGGVVQGAHDRPLHVRVVQLRRQSIRKSVIRRACHATRQSVTPLVARQAMRH